MLSHPAARSAVMRGFGGNHVFPDGRHELVRPQPKCGRKNKNVIIFRHFARARTLQPSAWLRWGSASTAVRNADARTVAAQAFASTAVRNANARTVAAQACASITARKADARTVAAQAAGTRMMSTPAVTVCPRVPKRGGWAPVTSQGMPWGAFMSRMGSCAWCAMLMSTPAARGCPWDPKR